MGLSARCRVRAAASSQRSRSTSTVRELRLSRPAITGCELTAAIARALPGSLEIKRMTWWLIYALRPIVPLCRELSEIAYLWNEPHRIDGSKLKAAIGDIPCTPLDLAVTRALEDLRAIA